MASDSLDSMATAVPPVAADLPEFERLPAIALSRRTGLGWAAGVGGAAFAAVVAGLAAAFRPEFLERDVACGLVGGGGLLGLAAGLAADWRAERLMASGIDAASTAGGDAAGPKAPEAGGSAAETAEAARRVRRRCLIALDRFENGLRLRLSGYFAGAAATMLASLAAALFALPAAGPAVAVAVPRAILWLAAGTVAAGFLGIAAHLLWNRWHATLRDWRREAFRLLRLRIPELPADATPTDAAQPKQDPAREPAAVPPVGEPPPPDPEPTPPSDPPAGPEPDKAPGPIDPKNAVEDDLDF